MTEVKRYNDTEARIASLETNQVRFHEDLQRLTRSFTDFDARMDKKFEMLTSQLSDNQKTPWTNIATGASLLLAVIIAVGSMNNSFVMSSIQNNADTITALDVTLQREMRLLNTEIQTQIELRGTASKFTLDELQRRMAVSEAWEDVHDKRVVGLNAAQSRDIVHNKEDIEDIKQLVLSHQLSIVNGTIPN